VPVDLVKDAVIDDDLVDFRDLAGFEFPGDGIDECEWGSAAPSGETLITQAGIATAQDPQFALACVEVGAEGHVGIEPIQHRRCGDQFHHAGRFKRQAAVAVIDHITAARVLYDEGGLGPLG
jgi:hypothetical protein